ncbi:hypothetical protein CALVIDRAFT_555552 [Calocera viscosa TUFC12733]|uniref:Uncharacterized protein n=1 Tax=Calocera viscosa (strain TUFC12733) TaxID=1330018 RepID=A0A167LLI4_CALVF|nr:hypothetical protein CALVIDRAFT_555552 [Calocera viscosa TUFC12733]
MNQGVVLIPFEKIAIDEDLDMPGMPSSNPDVDFVDAALLRLRAYQVAWEKCATRIRHIVDKLFAPVVQDVSDFLLDNPDSDDLLSPEVEIPTAVLSGSDQSATSYMLWRRLEALLADQSDLSSMGDGAWQAPRGFLARLSAKACPSISVALRTVTRNFAAPILQHVQQRVVGLELNAEDLRSLAALYNGVFGDMHEIFKPKLVLALEDVEAFDPHVVEDLIEICLQYAAQLPFRFLFTLSTGASYVQNTILRTALTGLRMHEMHSPAPEVVSEQLIRGLYFDPSFEPDVMIGPLALQTLCDLALVYNAPSSGLTSALQLMHMYHFYDPRSLFASPDLLDGETEELCLEQDDFADYTKAAIASKQEDELTPGPEAPLERKYRNLCMCEAQEIVDIAAQARNEFREVVRKMRSALAILLAVRDHCRIFGLRVFEPTMTALDVYQVALEGRLKDVVNNAVTLVRRMEFQQLQDLLEVLHTTCEAWPPQVRRDERELRQDIVVFKNVAEDEESLCGFGDKLQEYLKIRLIKLTKLPLCEAFCIDSVVDYAIDLINPSGRSSITAGLLQPMTWLDPKLDLPEGDDGAGQKAEEFDLATYPDVSILFHRSLDAGKKINLLDWFESFSMALENEPELLAKKVETPSPRKRRRIKVNGKQTNGTHAVNGKSAEEEAEDREQELQARFVRSVQELEYVGLLKHNPRRTDFAVRTVFEAID